MVEEGKVKLGLSGILVYCRSSSSITISKSLTPYNLGKFDIRFSKLIRNSCLSVLRNFEVRSFGSKKHED